MNIFEEISNALVDGENEKTVTLVKKCLEDNIPIDKIIDEGLAVGIRRVGQLWEEGEFFLPELMQGAEIMKAAMNVLNPLIQQQQIEHVDQGKIVIGTVAGDIHDIGKTLVASMLTASGFEVTDLGADVPIDRFISAAEENDVIIIALSALLTTTMTVQKTIIEELNDRGIRDRFLVLIGGAPVSQAWADEIGADGFAENAVEAVKMATELIQSKLI
ncbi:MAG: B12-binding domain-containing protein [Promethearchaeota archaeon]